MNNIRLDSEISESFSLFPAVHSKVQILNFMLSKGAHTEYGYFRRCKEELKRRFDTLEDLKLESEILEDDLFSALNELSKKKIKLKRKRLNEAIKVTYYEYTLIEFEYLPLLKKYKNSDIEKEERNYWSEVYKRLAIRTLKFKGLYEVHELLDGLSESFRTQVIGDIKEYLEKSKMSLEQLDNTMQLLEN